MTARITTSAGYNPAMTVKCEVYTTSAAAPVPDPSCSPLQDQTVQIAQNAGAQAFAINASSAAGTGKYTVRFTILDAANSQILEFPLYIVSPSPSLSLASGAAATESVAFTTPVNGTVTMKSFSCPHIWDATNKKMLDNSNSTLVVCGGPVGPISVTGSSTPISVSINTNPSSVSKNEQGSSPMYLASLLGMPIFAVIAWFGTRRSSRRNLLRFLGLVLVFIGLCYTDGCGGGSFNTTQLPQSSGIPAGSYQVQVIATDANGTNYYAQLPVTVLAATQAQ